MTNRTVTYVPASEILAALIDKDDHGTVYAVFDDYFGHRSAFHILVGNHEFLQQLRSVAEFLETPLSDAQVEEYWQIVGEEDFIDLET